jgi:hypothetical protein
LTLQKQTFQLGLGLDQRSRQGQQQVIQCDRVWVEDTHQGAKIVEHGQAGIAGHTNPCKGASHWLKGGHFTLLTDHKLLMSMYNT